MKFTNRALVAAWLLFMGACTSSNAGSSGPACFVQEPQAHVRQQFSIYGPMSIDHEFFGFIYRRSASIDSAVVRSRFCVLGNCVLDVTVAGERLSAGVQVLGEWHTHPRAGSASLSMLDVRGAWQNRNVTCYAAFFSRPDGEIFAWNPRQDSVPAAMASLRRVGNFATLRG
jgi:hypothetical protein